MCRKINKRIVFTISFLLLFLSSSFAADLRVHFIDVGQGDSILVIGTNNKKLLIDTGDHYKNTESENKRNAFKYIEKLKTAGVIDDLVLDYVLLTHYDTDHYKGFNYLCKPDNGKNKPDYFIGSFYYGREESNLQQVIQCIQRYSPGKQTIKQVSARGPPEIDLGEQVTVSTIYPFENLAGFSKKGEKNDNSIVLKITYKNNSFLLTGDISKKTEKLLLNKDISATVLKVGHHGSETSSSPDFLDALKLDYAVISANDKDYGEDGKKNYGHPTNDALKRLKERIEASNFYRTDLHGSIVFTSDGDGITVEPTNSQVPESLLWKSGEKRK